MMRSTKELRHVYRDFLLEANQSYSDIVVLEADLSSSMATNNLEKDFGDRYVNVGIMEAEMVGLAAGLSIQGFRPYLHTFGPFASRRVRTIGCHCDWLRCRSNGRDEWWNTYAI